MDQEDNNISHSHDAISGDDIGMSSLDQRVRFEQLTQLISECVWEADANGRFLFFCEKAFRVFGRHPHAMIGRGLSDIGLFKNSHDEDLQVNWKIPNKQLPFHIDNGDGLGRRGVQ